jgi:hypothetical protein
VFKVKSVIVHVDAVKFSIRDSKHDTLYKVIKPLATGLVKKQVQRAVQRFITTSFEFIDGQLVAVRDRMSEAKATDGDSPTKALQEVKRRIDIFMPAVAYHFSCSSSRTRKRQF